MLYVYLKHILQKIFTEFKLYVKSFCFFYLHLIELNYKIFIVHQHNKYANQSGVKVDKHGHKNSQIAMASCV